MRLYLRLLGAAIRSRMQYKLDFLLTSLLFALITSIDFLTVVYRWGERRYQSTGN